MTYLRSRSRPWHTAPAVPGRAMRDLRDRPQADVRIRETRGFRSYGPFFS
jgi:hypothetical protein